MSEPQPFTPEIKVCIGENHYRNKQTQFAYSSNSLWQWIIFFVFGTIFCINEFVLPHFIRLHSALYDKLIFVFAILALPALAAAIINKFFIHKFLRRNFTLEKKPGRWHDANLDVVAHFGPRHLWSSVSIDVYLDKTCILKTNEQFKVRRKQRSSFQYGDSSHVARLSWAPAMGAFVPYHLSIDEQPVANSKVYIRNWGSIFILTCLTICVPIGIFLIIMINL